MVDRTKLEEIRERWKREILTLGYTAHLLDLVDELGKALRNGERRMRQWPALRSRDWDPSISG